MRQSSKLLCLFFLLCLGFKATGQIDFDTIDARSQRVPDSLMTPVEIAEYLAADVDSDLEKARSLYVWIAYNIAYDVDFKPTPYNSEEALEKVLQTRAGVCSHYSELFKAMCEALEIRCFLVSGYVRDNNGDIADLSHAWNVVWIDSTYRMVDATWAAGYIDENEFYPQFNDAYFLVEPGAFVQTHMPFDPVWQFLLAPFSHTDFIAQDFSTEASDSSFRFEDSIAHHLELNRLKQLMHRNRRIAASGVEHPLIAKEMEQNELLIAYEQYNLAIDTLNDGVDAYNAYVDGKNGFFRNPKLEDAQIKTLIEQARSGIEEADHMLLQIQTDDAELLVSMQEQKDKLSGFFTDLEREEKFVERYLKTWKVVRIFLF